MRRMLRRLLRDESGSMVVWTTVGMLGFFAVGALVLDGGRIFNLHSQMQSYADHAALAAAAELDGDATAIGRAIDAAMGGGAGPIVTDTQNFATGAAGLTIQSMVFLSKLGTGMGAAGSVAGDNVVYTFNGGAPGYSADQSRSARFVQVTVTPRVLNYTFASVLSALSIGTATSSTVSAMAIAGFTRAACRFPPMMICNPTEVNPGDPFNWEAIMGKQILMKAQGPGTAWAPGDFGLLDLTNYVSNGCTGGGSSFVRCVLGLANPGTQCVLEGGNVDIEPGQSIGPVNTGMNVRFDIWEPPFQSKRGDPLFAPARNVIKGKTHANNQCRMNDLTEAPSVRLPRDTFAAGARIGNGVTLPQLQAYWTTNHPSTAWPFPVGAVPTRYDIYRYEIDHGLTPNAGVESTGPTCAAPVSEPASMDPTRDRRVLVIAVINCKENNIHGAQSNVPVENFALVFLTEPVGIPDEPGIIQIPNKTAEDILGEMVGLVKANTSNGVLHEFPVLYR